MLDDADVARAAGKVQDGPAGTDLLELADSAREATEFLKALAHETRLLILCLLVDGKKSREGTRASRRREVWRARPRPGRFRWGSENRADQAIS